MRYFVYDSSNNPIRQGTLNIIWNTTFTGPPLCTDDALVASGTLYTDIQWEATLVGSLPNQHVILQYINQGSESGAIVYFRIDRPLLPS